ncbi:VWA domain-containing protein [Alkalibaculum bacchi]|uniref:VWA domain-containing protein n=1 Tax=Alkalibaculum bacchi TaxID=645887 RepID=UPI003119255E
MLRAKGLKVSLHEWTTLMGALDKGLCKASLTRFYYLCRAVLVKNEADFDKLDGAFLDYFKDVVPLSELPEELLSWLENTKEKNNEPFDMHRAMQNKDLSSEDIQKMFQDRIKEQKTEHNGGSYWIGTGGVSVFGNKGFSPEGIRVEGEAQYKNALDVAGKRKFRDFRNDTTLDTRQFQVALRSLREFSSQVNQSKTELDIDDTVDATCQGGGQLKLVYARPRENTVKVLLLMDSGGSMEYYSLLCSTLFQAVSKSSHFKDLKKYYFHNCIYSHVYTEPTLQYDNKVKTEWIMQNISSDYKVIIVGDAKMHPSELLDENYYVYTARDKTAGIDWLKRIKEKYKHIVWLNPSPRPTHRLFSNDTYDIIEKMFSMYPLTVKDFRLALKELLVRAE